MSRGWTILLSDEPYLISFCMRALAAGSFLGIVWYHVDTDDAVAKVHLLSCCYLCLNLVLVDIFATISRNKQVFLRESIAEATNVLAFWGTEDTPWLALNFICCILCTIPMYILGELRPGMEHFFYFLMHPIRFSSVTTFNSKKCFGHSNDNFTIIKLSNLAVTLNDSKR